MQKRTFQVNDVLSGIPNAEIYWQLFEYAKSKGVPTYEENCKNDFSKYPMIGFDDDREIVAYCEHENNNYITFEQFFEYCDNWTACQPLRVKLNGEYTAEIIDGKVKVGCQHFEFSAIEELYNAIKNIKPE